MEKKKEDLEEVKDKLDEVIREGKYATGLKWKKEVNLEKS